MADNQISIVVSPEDKTAIDSSVETLRTKLQPYLIALSADERRILPKMSDKSISFVDKALNYVSSNPEFAPPYLNKDELGKDVVAVEILNGFAKQLAQIVTGLDDTIMLAGSEAYVAALAYYNSVKEAARRDILNAKPVYEDLKQRFPQRTKKVEPAPVQ